MEAGEMIAKKRMESGTLEQQCEDLLRAQNCGAENRFKPETAEQGMDNQEEKSTETYSDIQIVNKQSEAIVSSKEDKGEQLPGEKNESLEGSSTEREIQELKTENKQLSEKIENLNTRIDKLEEDLEKKFNSIKGENSVLKSKNDQLAQESKLLLDDNRELREEIRKLEKEKEGLGNEIRTLKEEKEALETSLKEEIRTLKGEKEVLETNLEKEISSKENEIGNLEMEIDDYKKTYCLFMEANKLFSDYQLVSTETKKRLESLFEGQTYEGFVSNGLQWENISILWNFMKKKVIENDMVDLETLIRVFKFFFNFYNSSLRECRYVLLEPKEDTPFDKNICSVVGTGMDGNITKVLLFGYQDIKTGEVFKALVSVR